MIKLDGASEAALNRKTLNFDDLLNLSTIERMKMNAIEGAAMTECWTELINQRNDKKPNQSCD